VKTRTGAIIAEYKTLDEINGLKFFEECKKNYPNIIRILITAYIGDNIAKEALDSGLIYKLIKKPINISGLKQIMYEASERFAAQKALQ